MVFCKTYPAPPFCEKEILRYAGASSPDEEMLALVRGCIAEVRELIKYRVCYRRLEVNINGDICDFGSFSVSSRDLAKNLSGCEKAIVFAATVGIELDRIIARYSRLSPAKALIFQAIGAERCESLCNMFCKEFEEERNIAVKPRFSPGYGDLALETQKDIFALLDCERKIGLTLTDSLLMSPTKSVTAFMGLCDNKTDRGGI